MHKYLVGIAFPEEGCTIYTLYIPALDIMGYTGMWYSDSCEEITKRVEDFIRGSLEFIMDAEDDPSDIAPYRTAAEENSDGCYNQCNYWIDVYV